MASSRRRPTPPPGLTRRRFLASTAAAGTLAALAPVVPTSGQGRKKPQLAVDRQTLFFNLAHEPAAAASTYYLIAGGKQYRLNAVTENAGASLLNAALRGNRFLGGVPRDQITHVANNIELPGDAVQLCYVKSNPDPTTGTWAMSSMFVHLPQSALMSAYARARQQITAGPLPLSAKRQLYGHAPAQSAQDLLDEHALKDVTDHASAMIGLHPDLLSVEPHGAANVHVNHIHRNGQTLGLAQKLQQAGPATPQANPGQPNAGGWATMEPLTDDDGNPIKVTNQNAKNYGLIQYLPAWNDDVASHAGAGISAVSPGVKDDETLGANVTGLALGDPSTKGTIWTRHDGVTTVDQTPGVRNLLLSDPQPDWTPQNVETDAGFWVKSWDIKTDEASGDPQLTVNFLNMHPRFLGIFVQFLGPNKQDPNNPDTPLDGDPLPLKDLCHSTMEGPEKCIFKIMTSGSDTTAASAGVGLSTDTAAYASLLGSCYQVFGVPVAPDGTSLSVTIPPGATSVRILAAGLGVFSPTNPTVTDDPYLIVMGAVMTALCNLAAPALAMAFGSLEWQSPLKAFLGPILTLIGVEVISSAVGVIALIKSGNTDWKGFFTAFGKAAARFFTGSLPGLLKPAVAAAVAKYVAALAVEGVIEDAVPIVGQIMFGVAVASGAAAILSTTIDCLATPRVYSWTLTRKHNVTVTLLPDENDANFPATAGYYKVTALFSGGPTPQVMTLDMPSGTVSSLPDVVFKDVPKGGQVNISVGFYSKSTNATMNDWLAGKGTTGLVDNSQDQKHVIRIEEIKVPLTSHTVYSHKQKTTLNDQGHHVWTPTSTPPSAVQADISCAGQGSLCDFRGITVRQGTSQTPGYVGYAWKANSPGVNGCAGGQGQFDLLANLGTSADPQSGYAVGTCGFPNGVQVAYNLLGNQASHFYLDSAAGVVRRVQLDQTPGFDPPSGKRAWGKLNLDSTALLLHPTGKLVSVNNANHKIETLRLPPAPMADDDAQKHLLADVRSGQGSRPGLIKGPSAAAVSPEGVVLILEDQHRIQAFDTGGGPVQFFKKQRTPYWLELTATAAGDTQYVDLAVEFTGYLYVLSYDRQTNRYRMDVYHPGQDGTTPISTTQGVNAARLAVDFWRNVYTLNYEVLQVPSGQALTEPSVSLWIPSPP